MNVLVSVSALTAYTFSVVSYAFHEEAIREILLRGVRFTGSPVKLIAFCNFMLDRDPPLFSFLHTFHINIPVRDVVDPFNPNGLLDLLFAMCVQR